MKILITGGEGQLGRTFRDLLRPAHEVEAPARERLDVTDARAAERVVRRFVPDLVLHCAAFTGVDGAESARREAFRVNVRGTAHLLAAARAVGATTALFSTDQLFAADTADPIPESAPPDPPNHYGWTKCVAEGVGRRYASMGGDLLIVRTSWVWGGADSFPLRIARLAREGEALSVVDDVVSRPTWVGGLADRTMRLLEAGVRGTVHIADSGTASKFDITRATLEILGIECAIERISAAEWGAPARRGAYSVLSLDRMEETLGHPARHWREMMHEELPPAVARGKTP
ncbi:MAG: NAD(P)-dependent oxidoreductase [Longimicrobiales bacterium]|nr:NAD(P)-dependent oxidoreductase [Longimicrobiales bacterium]